MLPHPLILNYKNIKINLNFSGVYSRNNLSRIKDWAYIIHLHDYESIGTHWIALYVNDNNATYIDSFGVDHIPKEIRKFIGNKNVITNIYRIQAHDPCVNTFVLDLYWVHVKS